MTDHQQDRGAVTHPLPPGIVTERDVMVPMRDGVRLAVTVYRPAGAGQYPVVMCVTAYGKDFGPDQYTTLPRLHAAGFAVGTMAISDVTTWEGPDPGFWVPHGYAVVVANARGFYNSEDQVALYSEQDGEDYADLIDWAGTQAWSSGAVGLNGVSYLAISQWNVASRQKPAHLKAIVPWEGLSDLLRDSVRHGGIPETRFRKGWYEKSLARGAGPDIVTTGPAMVEAALRHPFPLEAIDVPALICASWSDHGLHSRGSSEAFRRIGSARKWLFTHGRKKWDVYYSPEALEWQKAFFDHFLKGEDNGFDRRPPVRLEVRRTFDEYDVRTETAWPPATVRYEKRFVDLSAKRLTTTAPAEAQSITYDSETRATVECDLTFAEPIELTGPMVLALWVSASDADDLDLFVALRKIDRDGREVCFCGTAGYRQAPVAVGWLRVSERRLDPARSTPERPFLAHERPEPVPPGKIVPVTIEILPSSTAFAAGETLRLVISGRDIMEHAGFGHDATVNRGQHTIHAGGACPSYLLVPFC